MNNSAKVGSNPFDIFVIGARKGFNIADQQSDAECINGLRDR
jgi:hypothetical protein